MQSYRNLNILHGQYFLSSHVTFQQGDPIPRCPPKTDTHSCAWLIFLNYRKPWDAQLLHGSVAYSLQVWTYGHWPRMGSLRIMWGVTTNRWKNGTYSRIWRVSYRFLEGYVMSSSATLAAPFKSHHVSLSGIGVWLSLDPLDKCHLCGSICFTWIEVARFHNLAESHHFFTSSRVFIRDLHHAGENLLRNAWIPRCHYWRYPGCFHNCNSMLIRKRAWSFYLRKLTLSPCYYHAHYPHLGSDTPRASWWLSLFRWYIIPPPECCVIRSESNLMIKIALHFQES